MLLRLRLTAASLVGGALLLLLLCLGAQNLDKRVELNLLTGRSTPLPAGFVVGLALVLRRDHGPGEQRPAHGTLLF